MTAQVQVSRNHVSGYRVESLIFGEEGQIHVGRFEQNFSKVVVEAYGSRDSRQPLVHRVFTTHDTGSPCRNSSTVLAKPTRPSWLSSSTHPRKRAIPGYPPGWASRERSHCGGDAVNRRPSTSDACERGAVKRFAIT